MPKTVNLLDKSRHPLRVIWYLAWPILLEQFLLTFVTYADTAMVGALGPAATASIAVSSSASWVVNGLFNGLATGFSVLVARTIGADEPAQTRRVTQQAVLAIVFGGISLSAVMLVVARFLPTWMGAEVAIRADATGYLSIVAAGYLFTCGQMICSALLRCSGDTRTPLFFNLMTNVINVVLNFLFIFSPREITVLGLHFRMWGAGLGVRGAALATVIAVAFSALMLARKVLFGGSVLDQRGAGRPSVSGSIWREAFRYGAPVTLERLTINIGQLAMTGFVTSIGTIALAANQYALTAEAMAYMPMFAFATASTTLVSQSLGAKSPQLARRFGNWSIGTGAGMMVVLAVLMYAFAPQLVGMFTDVQEVIDLGAGVLRIEALAEPFFAVAAIVSGTLRGSRDRRFAVIAGMVGMWGVRLPLTWLLLRTTELGLYSVWIAMACDLFSRSVISYLRYRRYHWLEEAA